MKCEVLLVLIQVSVSYQQNILPEHRRRHCKALQEMDIMEHVLPDIRRLIQAEAEKMRRLYEDVVTVSDLKGMTLLGCEPGWLYHDNHCYLFVQTLMTWEKAVEECESKNAYLTDIQSAEENRFLKMEAERLNTEISTDQHFFIGGYLNRTEDRWTWKKTEDNIDYTDWGPDQPENTGQDCLILNAVTGYRWHDIECYRKFYMICKKKSQSQRVSLKKTET